MKIQESAENYLETILVLHQRLGQVRSIDVVGEMGFSKPSVSIAMKNFRENGLITMDESGFITLTDEGRAIAERTYERHQTLSHMLISLGVSEEVAREDACRLEHVLSEESYQKIRNHFKDQTKQ
ncbi:MAG: metal-dependent transcriptional regulator [Christensenellaceae bacterium]|nr:metal-dependent transcriptional regulator [Christensenellaceae bacterium]